MKIAVVGAGAAGLGAAWALSHRHDVTLFESAAYFGGHAHTVEVPDRQGGVAVDTGFIVYNERNYPHLTQLFQHLGVATRPSTMSFAFSQGSPAFEYAGDLKGLFGHSGQFFRTDAWRLLWEIKRFYADAYAFLDAPDPELTLGTFMEQKDYSARLIERHILPMSAAIWSCPLEEVKAFPALSFFNFHDNHGLLRFSGRPKWRTVTDGSREYVARLLQDFRGKAYAETPVKAVRRTPVGVWLTLGDGSEARFDQVVMACHADQTRDILGQDISGAERSLLNAFRYQANQAFLHRDPRLMPRNKAVWSSWNYLMGEQTDGERAVSVTYWMNRLQSLETSEPLLISLNPLEEPAPEAVDLAYSCDHPVFDRLAVAAQQDIGHIQGENRTWFCGSYLGYGFHEDALQSGLTVAAALDAAPPWWNDVTPASPAAANAAPEPRGDIDEAA